MRVPVLTAVTDSRWEAGFVAALERADLGVTVVRRCVDLADLLATAATGTARCVVVSSDLRRLDREALARLAVQGIAVVGLVPAADESAERQLRQLGVLHVLPADAEPERISAAVVEAVSSASAAPAVAASAPSDPRRALPDFPPEPALGGADVDPDAAPRQGTVIAVWGPAGAPGRTSVAIGVATELAAAGHSTVLVDADTYGGSVAQTLGLLDEAPGLAAAARLANNGLLDVPALVELARQVSPALRVLTGISRPERWPEIRPASVDVVLALCRWVGEYTVVDCGFCLEQDEELAFDQAAARRNGATLSALAAADVVLAVGSADPVSLQRLVRGLAELADVCPGGSPQIVINRLRGSVVPGDAEAEISTALDRYAGATPAAYVPLDQRAFDAAMVAGRSLAEAAPAAPARVAMQRLAQAITGGVAGPPRRRRLARRR